MLQEMKKCHLQSMRSTKFKTREGIWLTTLIHQALRRTWSNYSFFSKETMDSSHLLVLSTNLRKLAKAVKVQNLESEV